MGHVPGAWWGTGDVLPSPRNCGNPKRHSLSPGPSPSPGPPPWLPPGPSPGPPPGPRFLNISRPGPYRGNLSGVKEALASCWPVPRGYHATVGVGLRSQQPHRHSSCWPVPQQHHAGTMPVPHHGVGLRSQQPHRHSRRHRLIATLVSTAALGLLPGSLCLGDSSNWFPME